MLWDSFDMGGASAAETTDSAKAPIDSLGITNAKDWSTDWRGDVQFTTLNLDTPEINGITTVNAGVKHAFEVVFYVIDGETITDNYGGKWLAKSKA